MKQGHAPGHAFVIAWLIPILVLSVLGVALYHALPDHDVMGYIVGDDPVAFVIGFVCFYLLVAAILDMVVRIWEPSHRETPLSEDRLYDVLFWGIRGINIGMDPGRIADKVVERTDGRMKDKTKQFIDNAVDALRDAATRDQVLLWEDRERDLRAAEEWLEAALIFTTSRDSQRRIYQ